MALSKGLGRGLDSLLPADLQAAGIDMDIRKDQILTVSMDSLVPNADQPRKTMTQEGLEALAKSLQEQGVVQPLLVRRIQGTARYQIIAGERRWRAARMAGLSELPVYVKDLSDADVMIVALVENLQREDLNAAEEARALQELRDRLGLTQEQVAQRLGMSRSNVANTLRLLQLPSSVLDMVQQGTLSRGHARSLLPLADAPDLAARFAQYVLEQGTSVRECEEMVNTWKKDGTLPWNGEETPSAPAPTPVKKGRRAKCPEFKTIEKSLTSRLECKARLSGTTDSGRISLIYKNADELRRILNTLGVREEP